MKFLYFISKIIDISIILVILCISILKIQLSYYLITSFIFGFIFIINHLDLYILYKNLDIKEELKDEK
jgi:hypothetical protein